MVAGYDFVNGDADPQDIDAGCFLRRQVGRIAWADVLKLRSAVVRLRRSRRGKIMRNPFRRRPRLDLATAGVAASHAQLSGAVAGHELQDIEMDTFLGSRPRCECGWVGDWEEEVGDAIAEHDGHQYDAAQPTEDGAAGS